MKLPRWLTIAMLVASSLAILAIAAWWWCTWPERTAREFVRRVTQDEPWTGIVRPNDDLRSFAISLIKAFPPQDASEVEPQPRSIADVIVGRRAFNTKGEFGWMFTAQRSVVICPSEEVALAIFDRSSRNTGLVSIGGIGSIDDEAADAIRSEFGRSSIDVFFEGSIVYDILVPEADAERATEILRTSERLKSERILPRQEPPAN